MSREQCLPPQAGGVTRLRKAEQRLPKADAALEQDAGALSAVVGIPYAARSRMRGPLGQRFRAPRECRQSPTRGAQTTKGRLEATA